MKFVGGVPSASNYYDNNWRPEEAFKQNHAGKGWHSGPSGPAAPRLPLMIWYDFKSRHVRPAEVKPLTGCAKKSALVILCSRTTPKI